MGDLPVPKEQFLVTPNADVEKLWLKSAIAEKETRVTRLEADKDQIIKSQVLKIEATIIMVKREIVKLNQHLEKYEPKETIDITPTWSALILPMVEVLKNPKADPQAKKEVQAELIRLAKIVDAYNESQSVEDRGGKEKWIS